MGHRLASTDEFGQMFLFVFFILQLIACRPVLQECWWTCCDADSISPRLSTPFPIVRHFVLESEFTVGALYISICKVVCAVNHLGSRTGETNVFARSTTLRVGPLFLACSFEC